MLFKNRIFWFFILLILAQWYVPSAMIFEQENILKSGELFKFKTAPIDPVDPFRGRYVTLNFDENNFELETETEWDSDYPRKDVFVHLDRDSLGFAKIIDVTLEKPTSSTNFIKAKAYGTFFNQTNKLINIEYPFNRFYMDEFKAPKAEKIYREAQIDSTQVAYASVRIKEGKAVLENVFVNDKPIVEWVKEYQD